ncbi:vesicle-associated membrane protein 7-like [Watersipora subatra]|uniref:vesicle-associated membrane protein 7-like n=1 Tax=Watersipora subatra TaxID=2589382 RepID=UPI00355C7E91
MAGVLYCSVSRGPTILCSSQRDTGGNFDAAAESMLQNIKTSTNSHTSYNGSEHYLFHVLVQGGIVYLCATSTDYRKSRAFDFLNEILQKFTGGSLIARSGYANYMELQQDFSNVLAMKMSQFSKPDTDNIARLRAQVDDVKGVMTENIEKVMERGEKLDDLIDKTTDLEVSANTFRRTTRAVARKYWWQNMKMKIIIAVVIIVILVVIALIICGSLGVFSPKSGGAGGDDNGGASTTTTTLKP